MLVDNINVKLIDILNNYIPEARDLKIAVAFIKYSGFLLIENSINKCLERGCKTEFLVGLNFRLTEPKILKKLKMYCNEGFPLKLYCYGDFDLTDTSIFHPKLYLINNEKEITISIGSSNLTKGGLKSNFEANAVIFSNAYEEIASDVYNLYNKLKYTGKYFEPDLDYIEIYEEAFNKIKEKDFELLKDRKTEKIIKSLEEKKKFLPKPVASKEELFGWLKLVYEKIPEGTFKTSDIYKFKEEFQRVYPNNKNIEAKIRQQLQFLRDIGLIKSYKKGIWEKI